MPEQARALFACGDERFDRRHDDGRRRFPAAGARVLLGEDQVDGLERVFRQRTGARQRQHARRQDFEVFAGFAVALDSAGLLEHFFEREAQVHPGEAGWAQPESPQPKHREREVRGVLFRVWSFLVGEFAQRTAFHRDVLLFFAAAAKPGGDSLHARGFQAGASERDDAGQQFFGFGAFGELLVFAFFGEDGSFVEDRREPFPREQLRDRR